MAGQLRLRADPTSQQDRRCEVRACGQDDDVRVDSFARRRDRACGPGAIQHDAVDKGLRENGEVWAAPRAIEVGKCGVPPCVVDDVHGEPRRPCGSPRVVGIVEERQPETRCGLQVGDMQRRRVWRVRRADFEHRTCACHVRGEARPRPRLAPLVVVRGGACDGHARVVRGAPADYTRPEGALVLAAAAPVVSERQSPRIEEIRRPASGIVRAVVRPGLDHADRPLEILRQPRGDHTACGATPDHHNVVSHALRIPPGRLGIWAFTAPRTCGSVGMSAEILALKGLGPSMPDLGAGCLGHRGRQPIAHPSGHDEVSLALVALECLLERGCCLAGFAG